MSKKLDWKHEFVRAGEVIGRNDDGSERTYLKDYSIEQLYQAFKKRLKAELGLTTYKAKHFFTENVRNDVHPKFGPIMSNEELEADQSLLYSIINKKSEHNAIVGEMQHIAKAVSDYTTVEVEYCGHNEGLRVPKGFERFRVEGKEDYQTSPGDSFRIMFGLLKYVEGDEGFLSGTVNDDSVSASVTDEEENIENHHRETEMQMVAKEVSNFTTIDIEYKGEEDGFDVFHIAYQSMEGRYVPFKTTAGQRSTHVMMKLFSFIQDGERKAYEDLQKEVERIKKEYPATPDEAPQEWIEKDDLKLGLKKAIDEMFKEGAEFEYLTVGPKAWNLLQNLEYAETKTDRGMIYLSIESMPDKAKDQLNDKLMRQGIVKWNLDKIRLIKSSVLS